LGGEGRQKAPDLHSLFFVREKRRRGTVSVDVVDDDDQSSWEVSPAAAHAPVVWLTGLSAAGKSTLASGLAEALRARSLAVEVLDGDVLRGTLCRGLGYSREDRDENIRRIGILAETLARHGVTVVAATISPYRAGRDAVRKSVRHFVEVHVRCPLEILEARDPKGIYARARRGELVNVTGVDDPYEAPLSPELVVDTSQEERAESVTRVLGYLEKFFRTR
jgi:adenylyl-sulfate kinase